MAVDNGRVAELVRGASQAIADELLEAVLVGEEPTDLLRVLVGSQIMVGLADAVSKCIKVLQDASES